MLSASFLENRFFAALFSVSSQLQKLCPIRISCRNAVSTVCPLAVSLTHRPAAHLKPEAKNRLLPTAIHCSLNNLPCQEENEARLEGPSGRARNTKVKGDPLDIARPACPRERRQYLPQRRWRKKFRRHIPEAGKPGQQCSITQCPITTHWLHRCWAIRSGSSNHLAVTAPKMQPPMCAR